MSQKSDDFMRDLEALCRQHGMVISPYGDASILIYDARAVVDSNFLYGVYVYYPSPLSAEGCVKYEYE